LTLAFCDRRDSSANACSAVIPVLAMMTPMAWSITARESIAWPNCPARSRARVYSRALAIAAHAAVMYRRSRATSKSANPCGCSL
jgi:hypothetical protein